MNMRKPQSTRFQKHCFLDSHKNRERVLSHQRNSTWNSTYPSKLCVASAGSAMGPWGAAPQRNAKLVRFFGKKH